MIVIGSHYEHMFARIVGTRGDHVGHFGNDGSTRMAKNTGDGYRKGEVRQRSQIPNPNTDGYLKRDTRTGQFIEGKDGPEHFKGVRQEKK